MLSQDRYEVGYEGDLIGVYRADSPGEAMQLCRKEMQNSNFTPATTGPDRLKGLIAVKVEPADSFGPSPR